MSKLKDIIIADMRSGAGGGGGYPEPTGTKNITTNGSHDVKDYATAAVNVQATNPFLPAPSEGYTEYKNIAKTPYAALSTCGNVDGTATKYVNVNKGSVDTVQTGDKVLLTGEVSNQIVYAVWGTVTGKVTTSSSYDRLKLKDTGAAARPIHNHSEMLTASGSFSIFGSSVVEVHDSTAYHVFTGLQYNSPPETYGTVTVPTGIWGVDVHDFVVLQGAYNNNYEYIVIGDVTFVDNTTGAVTVNCSEVYPIATGGGQPVLISKTIYSDGTYYASNDNADGYSSVTVSTGGGGGGGSTFPDIDGIEWGNPPMPNQTTYSNGDFTPYMSTISVGQTIWVRGTAYSDTFLAYGTVRDINAQFLEIDVLEAYDAMH